VDEKGLVTVAFEAVEAGYGQLQRVEACGGAGATPDGIRTRLAVGLFDVGGFHRLTCTRPSAS